MLETRNTIREAGPAQQRNRWFREPLLHFLLAGGLLFAAYTWIDRDAGDETRIVRVTEKEVSWLADSWARQWSRPASDAELRGLVADFVKEELLALEAKELGLDEDDTIVRRRLAQKMEFLVQDTARLAEPSEDVLRRLYDEGRARYGTPARVSFTQVYFKTEADARQGLKQLEAEGPDDLGDASLLERDHDRADEQTVSTLFGPGFTASVFALETGGWHGPVESAYGFHLVRVGEKEAARPRPFEDARARVLDDWNRAQQKTAVERYFAELSKKYEIVAEESVRPLLGPLASEPPR